MYYKKILIITSAVFGVSVNFISAEQDKKPCIDLKTCATCVQNPDCAWCFQLDYHGQDKKQLPRCNTPANHTNGPFRCAREKLFSHSNELHLIKNDNLDSANALHMQPQNISMKLRVGDPISFTMKYKEVKDYPLELYYLMDGSYSMKDEKEQLVRLGDAIGAMVRKLTSKFSQGFGTFVDKVTMPFTLRIPQLLENPCLKYNYSCIPPYSFKNHMSINNNPKGFSDAIKEFQLSGNLDPPNGGLDALMQVMVCEKEIGWSTGARRLVIYATDGTFHFAGDGRLAGILLPNDAKCHMDSKGEYYTHSLMHDYPSLAQINARAKEHSINIIFAATKDVTGDYDILSSVIEGSDSTELAQDSSNIVDLVEKQYKKITSKVDIQDTFPKEFFKVTYFSSCNPGGVERETDICENLKPNTIIEFRIKIELIKCPPESKNVYRIYAVGLLDGISISTEALCNCPCEQKRTPNSPLCNGKGTEFCGVCECNADHFGDNCECSNTAVGSGVNESNACKQGNSTEICSGRGNCACRKCLCLQRYSGDYCECDNENCDIFNGQLCAGQGKCECGKCVCDAGWTGSKCECSTDRNTCFEPGSDSECSEQGKCVCGQCQCNKGYGGKYCEQCRDESCNRCEELKHCVQCRIHKTGIYNPADCELYCHPHSISQVEVISGSESDEVLCKAEDPTDQCVFIFSYKTKRKGEIEIKAQRTKECPPEPRNFWIIGIGFSIVVVIAGLILLCAYKAWKAHKIRQEYAAFKKDKENAQWTM